MASVNNSELADHIILTGIGGAQNVKEVTHCATRMRFVLKDSGQAVTSAVQDLPGVIALVKSSGQFQVVLGNNVSRAYENLPASLTSGEASGSGAESQCGRTR